MGRILYKIFKIILSTFKKHEIATDNPPVRMFKNKVESRITFKAKAGYYFEF